MIENHLANNADQAALSMDFIAYNRAVKSSKGYIGYGVSDKMEEFAKSLHFDSFTNSSLIAPLFKYRTQLQRPVDDFEDGARAIVADRGGVVVPATSDGSLGNDGMLALMPRTSAPAVLAAVTELCSSLGLESAAHMIHASLPTEKWLLQSERCLAAIKAAHYVNRDSVEAIGRCGVCVSLDLNSEDSEYIAKQERIFQTCSRRLISQKS
ncbi:hypothetical protein ACIPY2_05795 [Paenarthrobacter sp. NPDC089675]|uniref:hypothetical protein n=1 Tax=Paenarthrobacter sp. NPDC089675 TaxID=3364376 RepID=UPI0037F17A93